MLSLEADVLPSTAAEDIVSVTSVESVVSGSASEGVVARFDRVDCAYPFIQTETVVAGSSVKHITALVASKFIVSRPAVADVVACRATFFAKDSVINTT